MSQEKDERELKILALVKELENCREEGPEEGHMLADGLLLGFIDDRRVDEAFHKLRKWYA